MVGAPADRLVPDGSARLVDDVDEGGAALPGDDPGGTPDRIADAPRAVDRPSASHANPVAIRA